MLDAATRVAVVRGGARTPLRRLQHFLHAIRPRSRSSCCCSASSCSARSSAAKFLPPFNLSLVLQQVTIIGIVGIAQTLIVILTAGIDLSVGAIMVLCSVVMGKLAVLVGVPVDLAFRLGLGVGTLCGVINGSLVTRLRLPPFIVTLGTWSIFGALNLWYSRSETIRQQDVAAAAPLPAVHGHADRALGRRADHLSARS